MQVKKLNSNNFDTTIRRKGCRRSFGLARILHEGGRTMLWIYRHFNHLIKNRSLIVRLQFVRVVL